MSDSRKAVDDQARRAAGYERALASDSDPVDVRFEQEHAKTARVLRLLNTVFERAEVPPPEPVLPEKIGRFEVSGLLGRGGMGTVYQARDPELDRDVAIKVARVDGTDPAEMHRRLHREARAVATLDHPGIVPVYEIGTTDQGQSFLVMALCEGETLGAWIERQTNPIDPILAARTIADVVDAVQYGHQHNVLHRDLKPANVLLFPNRENGDSNSLPWIPRVTDFGLACSIDQRLKETGSSVMLGTPLYMSPEQAHGGDGEAGQATDIFSIGAILYHLLTGSPPFAASNYPAVLMRLQNDTPVPISQVRPEIDKDLATICMKCLERVPEDRYSRSADLAADLHRFLEGDAISARAQSPWHRLRRWSQRPARVSDLSAAIILVVCARIFFGIAGLVAIPMYGQSVFNPSDMVESLFVHGLVIIPCELWTIWAARQNQQRRLSPGLYWIAYLLTIAWCCVTWMIASGVSGASSWYDRNPDVRLMTFLMISILYGAQTICWYLADWRRIEPGTSQRCWRTLKRLALTGPVLTFAAVMLW
ncbi:Serine/threonine-protein kinase PknB [Rosistilla carotiformis]|uniref:Serine/threonine-protein kinase PknB n=1 Tax=Rosistilla carotiformis TaxID=2528017 RepID=A0A518JSX3_9BACT|nr:serine/threonine-protein kinase [Rosistilla carotiformis]QDV68643.1 Serine/threonine-protein kinase PknB [Rosistilla carotiformis]